MKTLKGVPYVGSFISPTILGNEKQMAKLLGGWQVLILGMLFGFILWTQNTKLQTQTCSSMNLFNRIHVFLWLKPLLDTCCLLFGWNVDYNFVVGIQIPERRSIYTLQGLKQIPSPRSRILQVGWIGITTVYMFFGQTLVNGTTRQQHLIEDTG
ncbi:hypothetical protein ACJX0J_032652 [Zea mays]